jgi:hypothetical protein
VYRATVDLQDVFCFTDHRQEQEVICRPRRYSRVDMSLDELQYGACRISDARNALTFEEQKRRLQESMHTKMK